MGSTGHRLRGRGVYTRMPDSNLTNKPGSFVFQNFKTVGDTLLTTQKI
jgi:hypothetical protein